MTSESKDNESRLRAWEDRTFAFLEERSFHPRGAALLLAVSGGADSMALLELWASAGVRRFGCRLHAVHVHHGLRASADGDQALVEQGCRELGVPLALFRLEPAGRRPGESMEMWARRERYRCFREAAEKAGAAFILTGHHRDDLVETVFQRLERGTGPRGLAGIPFLRPPGIVRPLLNRSRAEIEQYLGLRGRAWREDETNADLRIGRNWHRHRYLPALRGREPGLDARVFRLAMTLQDLGPRLVRLEEDAALLIRDDSGIPCLDAGQLGERIADGDFQSLRYWLGCLAAEAAGTGALVTEEILRELHRQWSHGTCKLRVAMGPGVFLERRNHGFYWEIPETGSSGSGAAGTRPKKDGSRPIQRIILDNGIGSLAWHWSDRAYKLSVRRYPRPPELRFPESGARKAIFDAELFSCTLLVRTRKDGDRFSPLGVKSESRKLKAFLNEEKIPVGIRDEIPLVFAAPPNSAPGDETLAWVPGHGISHFFKVGPQTASILEMELTCQNP